MCESNVFRIKNGEKKKLMDNVNLITVKGDEITLLGILGDSMKIKGRISRIDSEKHEVFIH